MAIFKVVILTFAMSYSLPLASGLSQLLTFASVQTSGLTDATAIALGSSPGSVIFKSEAGFPDFMTKKSLPAGPYPPAPKPYPAESNQTIAAL